LVEFGMSEATAAIAALPPGAIEASREQLGLGLLGLLLSDEGERVEMFLNDYLVLAKVRSKRDPQAVDITSEQVHAAYDMTDAELDLLGHAIERAVLHDGINLLNGPRWSFRRPANIAELLTFDDFHDYIRKRAFELGESTTRQEALRDADPIQAGPQPTVLHAIVRQAGEEILLETAQEDLLAKLVEAARSVPQDRRQPFRGVRDFTGGADVILLMHPGLANQQSAVYPGDIEQLAREGLVNLYPGSKDYKFDVTPQGYRHYEHLKEQQGESVARIEQAVRSFIDDRGFRARHPVAHEKWADAERQLWASETTASATVIGHLCREAHQEFVSSLLALHPAPDAPADPKQTKNRLLAALRVLSISSMAVAELADGLVKYWSAVSDLAQRQEHGGQKEGEALTWEDSRRLVFHTLFVMAEIDRIALRAGQ
jgi:hypothetical protein